MADKERRRKHDALMKSPVGVLAVHLKTLELTGIQPELRGLSYYVRICAADQMKHTGVYSDIAPPVKIMFDELKTFRLEISSKRHCEENNVRIEVIRFNPHSNNLTHEVAGRVELHIYEILKNLFNVATYDFPFSGSFHAHLETEICFSYGEFGYGFSNQIQNQSVSVAEQLGHSMFTFIEPPKDRSREEHALHIMTSLPVGHPEFLQFPAKAEHLSHEMPTSMTNINKLAPFTNCTAEFLMEKIGKRLTKVQTEYQKCKSRAERLSFVASVVNFEPRGSNYTNLEEPTFQATEAFHNHLHHKTYAMGKRDPFAYYQGPTIVKKEPPKKTAEADEPTSKTKSNAAKAKVATKEKKKKGMKQVVKSPMFMMKLMMEKIHKKRKSTSSDAESEASEDEAKEEESQPQKNSTDEEPVKPLSAIGNLILRLREAQRAEEEAAAAEAAAATEDATTDKEEGGRKGNEGREDDI